jgi:hypothetical protein
MSEYAVDYRKANAKLGATRVNSLAPSSTCTTVPLRDHAGSDLSLPRFAYDFGGVPVHTTTAGIASYDAKRDDLAVAMIRGMSTLRQLNFTGLPQQGLPANKDVTISLSDATSVLKLAPFTFKQLMHDANRRNERILSPAISQPTQEQQNYAAIERLRDVFGPLAPYLFIGRGGGMDGQCGPFWQLFDNLQDLNAHDRPRIAPPDPKRYDIESTR